MMLDRITHPHGSRRHCVIWSFSIVAGLGREKSTPDEPGSLPVLPGLPLRPFQCIAGQISVADHQSFQRFLHWPQTAAGSPGPRLQHPSRK